MPPVAVILPPAFATLFPGSPRCVALEAATVAEAMAALDARFPGMRDRLCNSTPAIRRHINVFVEGERAALHTTLAPGAEVIVMQLQSLRSKEASGNRGGRERGRGLVG